jgi:LacI family transcriptional regulator
MFCVGGSMLLIDFEINHSSSNRTGRRSVSRVRARIAARRVFVCPDAGRLVFVAPENDVRGQQLLNACRSLDVAIPGDIGVIGVDDDDAICMMCDPTLSSVRPNAERVGYRAAEVLHGMLWGIAPEQETEYVAPLTVTERQSTQVVAVEDEELARVCRFIRQAACDGINVADVVEFSSLSRRPLERRFRDELDITPRELITETQIERVKQLLRETGMTLEQISKRTGFSHKERPSAVFKRETGQTPGCYREEHSA